MKNVMLFAVIFSLMGVIKKPETIQPCSDTVYCHFYSNGKKVAVTKRKQVSTFAPIGGKYKDQRTGKVFYPDSMAIKLTP